LNQIEITFKDKSTRSYKQGTTVQEIIQDYNPKLLPRVFAAKCNHQKVDLTTSLQEDTYLEFLTCQDDDGLNIFWHSSSHIMAQAVKQIYPDAQLGIGPAISRGFYYDFRLSEAITPESLPRIEEMMHQIVDANQPFHREIMDKQAAIRLFRERNEPFKLELIQDLDQDSISVYSNGDFIDLCRGPHLPGTGMIGHFKLLSVAGAYWRGDERNAVMQRIYGISYPDEKSLKKFLNAREEAQKRDHRKLGRELDLFSFHTEGPGFPLWHPAGSIIFNEVTQYIRHLLDASGYVEIRTPIILNEQLWHQSGHWDNYKENMYFTTIDEQTYAVKPMNCPGGLLYYNSNPHSYRDLPLRVSELGMVHRHEKSGVLHGLFRVRQFTQDDAHVYCTESQMLDEIVRLIELIEEVYTTFGFTNYQIELSTRPAKSIGTPAMWKRAEEALAAALDSKGIPYQINEGEGAFYGPKIDYHIQDSLDRLWQCGTIQLDFSMPERFQLEYVGDDGSKHRPVMIHRAIFGSVERFIGILIEHYGGAFPLWLAPVQCSVIPISEKHLEYAKAITNLLKEQGIRCMVDDRNEKVGYKIREAETRKIPYMAVVGDKEVEEKTVSLRKRRKGDQSTITPEKMVLKLKEEIERRTSH